MVGFGAGGGTGSGSVVGLIEIAKRYARYIGLKNPDKKVGVVMTLPTVGEASSPLVAENAYNVACELSQMASAGKISPLIIVDNDKINKMYPGMTVKSFWPSINNTVASLFDIFNRLSALSSRYTDNIDYAFDVLSEITGQATIHRGIYEDGRDCLRVYTIIGGLDSPAARLEELRSRIAVGIR